MPFSEHNRKLIVMINAKLKTHEMGKHIYITH